MEKVNRFCLPPLLFLLASTYCFCVGTEPPDNFSALKMCAADFARGLSEELASLGASQVELDIESYPSSWVLEQSIIENGGKTIFVKDSARPYKATLSIESFRVSFSDLGNKGLLERVSELKVAGRVRMPSGELSPLKTSLCSRKDTLTRDQAEEFNGTSQEFARGALPPERSFIKKYAEPVLAVAVSALAVFLFFTVRSN